MRSRVGGLQSQMPPILGEALHDATATGGTEGRCCQMTVRPCLQAIVTGLPNVTEFCEDTLEIGDWVLSLHSLWWKELIRAGALVSPSMSRAQVPEQRCVDRWIDR
mmetsp:Transcript_36576/g.54660  ORF Transcript_36576/g.54660 Transcript_36576/m.54660 type:complete len:106 (-) Transcript_36576:91-408(-)